MLLKSKSYGKCKPETGELMILNDICEVRNDPDREARLTLK